ncbi:hypothetical protein D9619_002874 [Psilocybe cf. subviscida]|uniref:Uncharacterized protein n=1 Tax=Psilocybe cf. subviscida TaxID=2480587 RepID=A0A8H5AXF5_9AGAR|nr:hypothetical protein D9619_002874 [Psilocybe cf. subviscida]
MNIPIQSAPPIPGFAGLKNGFKKGPTPASSIKPQSLSSAQQAYRNAQFVLENKKRAVPSLDEMKKALMEDPLIRVEKQLAQLKENHAKDLQILYAYQDREVHRELIEQRKYISCNQDFIFESTIDVWDSKESLFGRYPSFSLAREHQSQYEQLKHAYLVQLLELTKKKQGIETLKAMEKKRLERAFPQTIEEFNTKPKDLQVSAAKFFDANHVEQEKMLVKNHWTRAQVTPLQNIFNADKKWQSDLRAWLIDAHKGLVDPRRRPI